MKLSLLVSIVAIAGSIAEPLSTPSWELYPRYLITGNAGFTGQYSGKVLDQLPNTRLDPSRNKAPAKPTKTLSHTILPRGNCAGKPCGAASSSPQTTSDQRPTSNKKSEGPSSSRRRSKSPTPEATASRQPSSGNPQPQSHTIEQIEPVKPSRTQHIQQDKLRPYPIPFPNFIKIDQAAARARPSRATMSKEFKNPSQKPMNTRFTVHGPGTVSLTTENEKSYSTESYNVKKGESLVRNLNGKYGARVQGTTETGAQFDLAAKRAYMGLHSHDESGSAKSTAWGPDGFSRNEAVRGKGRSEVELKSHADQQFVEVAGRLVGKGGFHAHTSAGIPLE